MQHVDVKIHGTVASIILDRRTVRNALNPSLLDGLREALSDVHQERRIRSVVLMGAGDHFCSGVDLRSVQEIAALPGMDALAGLHDYWRRLTELYEQMLRFPKPIVAAVDGVASGAGLGLALACDLVVASSRARFIADASRRGLVGGGTAALLAFRLGGSVAARMSLTGRPLDADEAHRAGLLAQPPVPTEQVWVAACETGRACDAAPAEAIQATKRLLNENIGEQLLIQLASGAAGSATACTTDAAMEGLQAFLEKREPQWP